MCTWMWAHAWGGHARHAWGACVHSARVLTRSPDWFFCTQLLVHTPRCQGGAQPPLVTANGYKYFVGVAFCRPGPHEHASHSMGACIILVGIAHLIRAVYGPPSRPTCVATLATLPGRSNHSLSVRVHSPQSRETLSRQRHSRILASLGCLKRRSYWVHGGVCPLCCARDPTALVTTASGLR